MSNLSKIIVLIKGAGEIASGIAHKLHCCHFKVCLTETDNPLAVSRGTAFSEAVFEGVKTIEEVTAELVPTSREEIHRAWRQGNIPIIVDPDASVREQLKPDVLVDAIMADPKLAQWKAEAKVKADLLEDEDYLGYVEERDEAKARYDSAKITAEILREELKTYRAECYAKAGALPF